MQCFVNRVIAMCYRSRIDVNGFAVIGYQNDMDRRREMRSLAESKSALTIIYFAHLITSPPISLFILVI